MPPRHGAGYLIYLYCNIIIAATAQQGREMIVFHNQIIKLNRYVLELSLIHIYPVCHHCLSGRSCHPLDLPL